MPHLLRNPRAATGLGLHTAFWGGTSGRIRAASSIAGSAWAELVIRATAFRSEPVIPEVIAEVSATR